MQCRPRTVAPVPNTTGWIMSVTRSTRPRSTNVRTEIAAPQHGQRTGCRLLQRFDRVTCVPLQERGVPAERAGQGPRRDELGHLVDPGGHRVRVALRTPRRGQVLVGAASEQQAAPDDILVARNSAITSSVRVDAHPPNGNPCARPRRAAPAPASLRPGSRGPNVDHCHVRPHLLARATSRPSRPRRTHRGDRRPSAVDKARGPVFPAVNATMSSTAWWSKVR